MVTSNQVKKLHQDEITIMKAKYYKSELRYISRRIQWAVWRHRQEIKLIYDKLAVWQHKILVDILNDYTILGYTWNWRQETKNTNIITIVLEAA